jgi:hypothetical protein
VRRDGAQNAVTAQVLGIRKVATACLTACQVLWDCHGAGLGTREGYSVLLHERSVTCELRELHECELRECELRGSVTCELRELHECELRECELHLYIRRAVFSVLSVLLSLMQPLV